LRGARPLLIEPSADLPQGGLAVLLDRDHVAKTVQTRARTGLYAAGPEQVGVRLRDGSHGKPVLIASNRQNRTATRRITSIDP
jgi:hypothetical protein